MHKNVKFYTQVAKSQPDDAIFTKIGTAVDPINVTTSAYYGCYRVKGEHSAVKQNSLFPVTSMAGPTKGNH